MPRRPPGQPPKRYLCPCGDAITARSSDTLRAAVLAHVFDHLVQEHGHEAGTIRFHEFVARLFSGSGERNDAVLPDSPGPSQGPISLER